MKVEQSLMALDRYITRRWRELPDELSNLTPTEYDYLTTVHEMEPVGLSALAECMLVSKPTASNMVDRLKRKGLLAKRPSPKDGRSVLLYLSQEGEKLLELDKQFYKQIIDELLEGMPHEDQQQLESLLARMVIKSEPFYINHLINAI